MCKSEHGPKVYEKICEDVRRYLKPSGESQREIKIYFEKTRRAFQLQRQEPVNYKYQKYVQFRVKSKAFHHHVGTPSRNGKQKKWARKIDQASEATLSSKSAQEDVDCTNHKHRWRFFEITRMKIEKYIRVPQAEIGQGNSHHVESRAFAVIGSSEIALNCAQNRRI